MTVEERAKKWAMNELARSKAWGQCDGCSKRTQHLHPRMSRINESEREAMLFCVDCDGEDTSGNCDECEGRRAAKEYM